MRMHNAMYFSAFKSLAYLNMAYMIVHESIPSTSRNMLVVPSTATCTPTRGGFTNDVENLCGEGSLYDAVLESSLTCHRLAADLVVFHNNLRIRSWRKS